jgi:hypothetical protein
VAVSYRPARASIIDPGQFSQHDIRPIDASLPEAFFAAISSLAAPHFRHFSVNLSTHHKTKLLPCSHEQIDKYSQAFLATQHRARIAKTKKKTASVSDAVLTD